jgi:phosphate transport system permease protein
MEYGLKNFLFGNKWAPSHSPQAFGILPMIVGSLLVTLGAIIIGVPIGVLTATYLAKFSNKKIYRFLKPSINLMAGIPSIVYGFFALVVVVPVMRNLVGGTGMNIITASLLLGIMILPTIIGLSESSIRSVPESYYEGSVGLGASHERAVMTVILPAAKSGIISSVILGIGRAIGETMAVILVAGNQPQIPSSLTQGVRTLTTNIVLEMGYAAEAHREALIATAVVLFVFILLINGIFLIIKRRAMN